MQTNSEIRNEAWRLLWERKWFWKLLGAAILLQVCSQVIITIVNGVVYRLGVFNITAMTNMIEERIPLPEFTPRIILELASSTVLIFFLSLWSRAFRLSSSDAEAPSSNRACGFPAHGFPCETGVIGISFL